MNRRSVLALPTSLGVVCALSVLPLLWALSPALPRRPQKAVASATATARMATSGPLGPDLTARRLRMRSLALPLFDEADRQSRTAISDVVGQFAEYLRSASRRTPRLADEVLGLSGQWRLVADQVPFTAGDRHLAFLRAAFARQLFSTEDLKHQARAAVEGYLQAEHAIEDHLLVRLHQDLADLPGPLPDRLLDLDTARVVLDRALAETAFQARLGLQNTVSRELVALIVGEALAGCVLRAGVPAVLASSAPYTLGAGVAAALAVDQALVWTWDRWADPKGRLVRTIQARLVELGRDLIEGTPSMPGLRPMLEAAARERADRRRQAILAAIDSSGAMP